MGNKESLKILAETVRDNYYESNTNGADSCKYCGIYLDKGYSHHKDCPYLIAVEVLSDKCLICGHTKGTMICVNLKCDGLY